MGTQNITVLSLLAMVESLHLLVVTALVAHFVQPFNYDPTVWNKYFPFLQAAIRPNHNFFLYHCWLVFIVIIQLALMIFFRRRIREDNLWKIMRAYISAQTALLFLMGVSIFKIIIWNAPGWAWGMFYVFLSLSWGLRIFWPEASKWGARSWRMFDQRPWGMAGDLAVVALMVLLIVPIDLQAVLARIFIQERFYHFNGVIMSPAWAYLSGCVLNIDVICQYGLGMTIAVAKLAQALGGFTYEHVLLIFVGATIIYFMSVYAFLRLWLNNVLLSIVGLLLCMKFQMFHAGVAFTYWVFLSATVARYFFDMSFFMLLLLHIRGNAWALAAASACVGIALAYMLDTGVYLWFAFGCYLAFLSWEKKHAWPMVYAFIPLALAAVILFMLQGSTLFSSKFWQGAATLGATFLAGRGALPIYTNLAQGQFFAFFFGILIPVVYVFSFIYAASQFLMNSSRREKLFVPILCVYALGLYHYYICRSAVTSYHVVDIPFVLLLCYWAKEMLERTSARFQKGVYLAAALCTLGGLLTNNLFVNYPNALNLSKQDWSKAKEYFHQQSDVHVDAQLIARLTKPQDKVAVLAPYATEMLIASKRKPLFFYSLPLRDSDMDHPDHFTSTVLFSYDSLKRTMDDLQGAAPQYVFVDPTFFRGQLPSEMYEKSTAMKTLFDYVRAHYEESGLEGRYVIALKRKGNS